MAVNRPTVTVRLDDLRLLLYAFDNTEATALGSRPFERLRAAAARHGTSVFWDDYRRDRRRHPLAYALAWFRVVRSAPASGDSVASS